MTTATVKSKRETAGLINLGTAVPRRNNIKYMQPPHHKIPLIALYVGMIKLSHTAGACFAVLSGEVSACFIHCFYYEVKRDLSRCGKEIGKVNGIYGTHCGYGIPLYTRNLHEAVYRVARKSQMMLYGVFGGILYLLKAHSEKLAESRCGHGTRRSDFRLTAALCTAYRCICFYQKPDNRRRSECLFYFSVAVSPLFWKYSITAGKTPLAPHVGAVTMRPPAAFCSPTA